MGTKGNSREKQLEDELARQRTANSAAAQAAIATATAPDPLEERKRARSLAWLDWQEGKSGPIDIEKAPGFGPELDLYNRASQRRAGQRMGIGALRMGVDASNPEIAARIAEQQDVERQQEAAGSLENAYRMRSAEVDESILPLVGMRQGKNLSLASLATGREANATDAYIRYLSRQKKTPFWQSLLFGVKENAERAAAASAGGA